MTTPSPFTEPDGIACGSAAEAEAIIRDLVKSDPLGLADVEKLRVVQRDGVCRVVTLADAGRLLTLEEGYSTVPINIDAYARWKVWHFNDERRAVEFIQDAAEEYRIVLGDIDADGEHPEWLVATPVDAERLVRLGYEYGDEGLTLDNGMMLSL